MSQSDPTTASESRRERAAARGRHVGETWRFAVGDGTVTGLVRDERLRADGTAEWTLVVDGDGTTQSVAWDEIESAEQLTPDCPICATAGLDTCALHGGGVDE